MRAFDCAFAHDGQHHFVLLTMAIAGCKACALHPAVFLIKVMLGMGDQLIPQRGQLRVGRSLYLGQQGDELFVHRIHDGHIQHQCRGPFQIRHLVSFALPLTDAQLRNIAARRH